MGKHYKGEKGTIISLDVGQDISTATTFKIEVEKPDGTKATLTGTLDTDKRTILYTLTANDFDQTGLYKLQAHVIAANGDWLGETVELYVYETFE